MPFGPSSTANARVSPCRPLWRQCRARYWSRDLTHHRGDVDDPSPALTAIVAILTREPEACRQVGIDHRLPIDLRQIVKQIARYQACVVHQDVQPAELSVDRIHRGADRLGVGYVEGRNCRASASLL
jgi:hypothetical protein